MEAKFIDKDHGIVSVSLSQFRKDSQDIAFLYYPGRDWIIVNEDNTNFDFWKEIVPIYVGFTDFQKKGQPGFLTVKNRNRTVKHHSL